MRLKCTPPPLTVSVLLLSCAAVVNANFDLYSGYVMQMSAIEYEQPIYIRQ